MGKLTISMAIFNSYVKLPEPNVPSLYLGFWETTKPAGEISRGIYGDTFAKHTGGTVGDALMGYTGRNRQQGDVEV